MFTVIDFRQSAANSYFILMDFFSIYNTAIFIIILCNMPNGKYKFCWIFAIRHHLICFVISKFPRVLNFSLVQSKECFLPFKTRHPFIKAARCINTFKERKQSKYTHCGNDIFNCYCMQSKSIACYTTVGDLFCKIINYVLSKL